MRNASPHVVPNVFLQNACVGSVWAAEAAWVKRIPELNGHSPYEAWDHPELLLSKEDLKTNPAVGPMTLAAIRIRIINTVRPRPTGARLTPADVHLIGNLPFVSALPSVRDEDPAPAPETVDLRVLRRFKNVRMHGLESMLLANRRRQRHRHSGRARSHAFRRR